jgi:hypothetical protein
VIGEFLAVFVDDRDVVGVDTGVEDRLGGEG